MEMRQQRWANSISAAIACVALTWAVPATSWAAQPLGKSPLAGTTVEDKNYPDGGRIRSQYEILKDGKPLPSVRIGMKTTDVSEAVADGVKLPSGFKLRSGRTTKVMDRGTIGTRLKATSNATPDRSSAKYVTLYPVEYKGVPLAKGGDYLTVVSEDGRLLATRQRNFPSAVDATKATVEKSKAVDAARRADKGKLGSGNHAASDPTLEIWVDGNLKGHLAWTFTLASNSLTEPKAIRYWISAVGEPRVLNWESEIYHTHFGVTSGTIWKTTPLQATANRPISDLTVNRSIGGSQVTEDDGRYSFVSGVGSTSMSSVLSGPHSVIENIAGPVMSINNTGTPANSIDLNFGASTEFELAQVTAFYWTNVAQQLANGILIPTDLPALPTRVNINSSCNAFWNGNSINFFRAGSGCPNTAYSDVVLHEYGHGVDARKGGILDGGYSEGFGDALAILGTRQSCLGRDFFGAGTCLRPATDVILWPPAAGEGVHAIGRRYAGFTWALIERLRDTYSEEEAFAIAADLVLAAAVANPSNIPDAVYLSFVADDTDGNLATCSPHFHELAAAADSRNIPRPADCFVSLGSPGSAGHFSWAPVKKVSTNSNILEVNLHLDEPMEVHLSANSSALRKLAAPARFTTGFYNAPATNTMWSYSLRDISLPGANQWVNFGSMMSISLPAGNHTFYWKIWVSGGELEFSGGTMLVEGFRPSATAFTGASAAAAKAKGEVTKVDARGKRTTDSMR